MLQVNCLKRRTWLQISPVLHIRIFNLNTQWCYSNLLFIIVILLINDNILSHNIAIPLPLKFPSSNTLFIRLRCFMKIMLSICICREWSTSLWLDFVFITSSSSSTCYTINRFKRSMTLKTRLFVGISRVGPTSTLPFIIGWLKLLKSFTIQHTIRNVVLNNVSTAISMIFSQYKNTIWILEQVDS